MFYWIPHAVGELHISITVPTQELWLKMAPKIELTNLWPLAAPKWIKWMKRIKKAHHNIHQYLSAYGKLDMGFLRKCAVKDVGLLACEVSEYDLDIFCKKKQSWKKRERPCLRVKWAWTGRPPSLDRHNIFLSQIIIAFLADTAKIRPTKDWPSHLLTAGSDSRHLRLQSQQRNNFVWRDSHEDHIWAMNMAKL